jgi:hypothetical protein
VVEFVGIKDNFFYKKNYSTDLNFSKTKTLNRRVFPFS